MSSPGVADGRNGCDVVTHALAPQPQLEAGEPAFVAQLDRLGGYRGRLFQPQAIAVVGGHRPDRAAEKDAQRHAGRLCERVPRGHVEPGHGDHRHALIADEMQRLARERVQLDRCDAMAFQQVAKIVKRWDQVLHRFDRIGLEIAAADDTFIGVQIDQDERPIGDRGDSRDDRPCELQHDGPCPDAAERQPIRSACRQVRRSCSSPFLP